MENMEGVSSSPTPKTIVSFAYYDNVGYSTALEENYAMFLLAVLITSNKGQVTPYHMTLPETMMQGFIRWSGTSYRQVNNKDVH